MTTGPAPLDLTQLATTPAVAPALPTTTLATALMLAELGWHVLPTRLTDKAPRTDLVRRGHLDATTWHGTITSWWSQAPDAGVGIACAASGLVVVDVDTDQLDLELEQLLAGCPWQVRTGRGRHYYYLARPGARYVGRLGHGVDVKHQGYVVAPPTPHPAGGTYQLEATGMPTWPPAELERQLLSRRQR